MRCLEQGEWKDVSSEVRSSTLVNVIYNWRRWMFKEDVGLIVEIGRMSL